MSDQGSDPLSNPEIEDVLSSIRRLVSEDTRGDAKKSVAEPAAKAAPKPDAKADRGLGPAVGPGPAADQRLVLTPAQRVEDAGAAAEPVPQADAPAAGKAANGSDLSLEATVAELEAAVAGTDEAFEPDGGEGDALPDAAEEALAGPGATDHYEADAAEDAAAPEHYAEDSQAVASADSSGEDDADAAPEAATGGDEDIVAEPDEIDELAALDALDGEQDARFDHDDLEAEALAGDIAADLAEDSFGKDDGEREEAADRAGLSIPVFAHGGFDRDTLKFVTPSAGATMSREEIEAIAALTGAAPRPGMQGQINDAALRALVAECLRHELQGPLGERITRNVRKLVRREIQRALAAKDFD